MMTNVAVIVIPLLTVPYSNALNGHMGWQWALHLLLKELPRVSFSWRCALHGQLTPTSLLYPLDVPAIPPPSTYIKVIIS